ncbi:MAG: CDP-alcohol phosphatidyltransferase family protein [Chloroflexi bacterium]|nr:CDP-alcohol phosphatidyltransferase family protein [Chloroflexota bacterium]
MVVAKQVADLITTARVLIAVYLMWLGITHGAAGLPLAAWLMIADWAGDAVDGRIARRSRIQYRTWIGDHDLEVDMSVSAGLLIYMLQAGFVNGWLAGSYILLWGVYFWRQGGIPRSPGMLFQAPIYGWFIWVSLRDAPQAGWAIVVFLASAVALTWPYFPRVMVPDFLKGLHKDQGK